MKNRRIIMADPDASYLLPLQLKFIEELRGDYEFELITDEEFYRETFRSPQDAECMIVREDWYGASLARHNIDNIVVLTERPASEDTAQERTFPIYKYSTIDEIFNQVRIILISHEANAGSRGTALSKDAKVVVFYSADGGAGKTTLAMSLATYLVRNQYKRVLYLSTGSIQSFLYHMENRATLPNDMMMALMGDTKEAYSVLKKSVREEKFHYLPAFSMPLFSYGISEDVYLHLIEGAKASRDYDWVIVDADSVLTPQTAMQIQKADKVMLIVRQTEESAYAMDHLLTQISDKDGKFVYVCNDYNSNLPNACEAGKHAFTVNEYVSHCASDTGIIGTLAATNDIQRLAILMQ
ncbi:MAG: AAA family ATPase [Mogibacterium sp.]|nr:AAA family ATPase [Mogibacterium sp.]